MNVLIVYGTTEGQTRKIATFIADRIRGRGENVTLIDNTDLAKNITIDDVDAVIAAGSVHNGRHQAALFQFVRDRREVLQAKPSAFISVSLSMASDDKQDRLDAAACADRFFEAAEWKPTVTHLVAGAIRYSQYDFFKSWILRMIASTKGASTDTSQDHEFTDWKDLEAFADAFLAQVAEHMGLTAKTPEKHTFTAEESELFARDRDAAER
ncbi:MAG: flavodoxin domain-containing protein [Geminicoccaceae bacterium]